MYEEGDGSGASQNGDHGSILDVIGSSLDALVQVLVALDKHGLSISAIHVDQAIENLRREQVRLRTPI